LLLIAAPAIQVNVFHLKNETKKLSSPLQILPATGRGKNHRPRWSSKAEALYVDLDSHTGIFNSNGDPNLSPGFVGRLETVDTMRIVRAGVNFNFGG
jgi:hypothetical protein